jgi:NADH-quinone oxidoreductase subunit L
VPALWGGGARLHHWLEPVTAAGAALLPEAHLSASVEWTLVAIAVAVAATGIVGAWRILKPESLVPASRAPAESGLAKVLWRKWYVDELYDFVFVRPLLWFSREVLWKRVDQGLIDGAGVNGAAAAARVLGALGARLQTGQVGVYVALFVIGVLAVLWRAMG